MNTQANNIRAMISTVLPDERKSSAKKSYQEKQLVSTDQFMSTPDVATEGNGLPVWRVRFEVLKTNTPVDLCLKINGDIILGVEDTEHGIINLLKYDNKILGVSRRHLQLSPTETDLLIMDLGSTNGTRKNGRFIQPNMPYRIYHGDILELGDLILAVNILKAPYEQSVAAHDTKDIANALTHISSTIISNLSIDDVLDRLSEMAIRLCQADEIALLVWDKEADKFFLRAERGMASKEPWLRGVSMEELLVNEALRIGEPLRSIPTNGRKHEVMKGYLVDASLYVPISMGEDLMGILIAMQTNKNREFTKEHESMLCTIGKFAAIAIQNSEKSESTNLRLQSKLKELSNYENISKALSITNNLADIYNVLRNQIREQWNVENIGLWLVEETTNRLVPFPKPSFHKTYSMGEEIIGAVASRAEPNLATDIKLFSEPTNSAEPTLQLLARSAVCVPIVENKNVLGVLAVFSKRENEFDEEDIHLLQIFSQAASAAIRNASLFEQVDKQRSTILAAVNMLPHPMMIVDQDGKIIVSNKAADTMLREVHSSINGKDISNPALLTPLTKLMHGLSESKWRTKEIVFGDKVYVATLEYASMIGTVILMQDVTDPVTGTANHRHFHDLAEQAFQQARRYAKPLTALIIGSDDIKRAINQQGQAIGNKILKGFAAELRGFLRTPDILGRYQENEFIVILPETSLENAKFVADRIIASMFKKSIAAESYNMIPKLRIGIATLDSKKDTSLEVLMEKAYGAFALTKNDNKHQISIYKDR